MKIGFVNLPKVSETECGHYHRYPESDALRKVEGGRRLQRQQRASLPNMPLVSIITPVLNRATSIARTINSVRVQTYPNIEHIIIDGGSTDSTVFTLLSYADCLDYFISESDDGIYSAINKGLSLAHGEYILILNSDDWYLPNTVELLVKTALSRPMNLVSALAYTVDQQGNISGAIPHFPFDDYIYLRMSLRHELMLVPKSLYNSLGYYDTSYALLADLKFAQQLWRAGISVYEIPQHLMYFNMHGASSNFTQLLEERRRLLLENFPFISTEDCESLSTMTQNSSSICFKLLDKYRAEESLSRALRAYIRFCPNFFSI